jgi:hypothetical protein
MAWQGQYKGSKKVPTLVMEAISDYHMWFWHCAYGYAGTLNDRTILELSPFLRALIDGRFIAKEESVVPYEIAKESFDKLFILCDGIYPQWSRFVKGFKEPVLIAEKYFSEWQESSRKDIERAFGCLQSKYQYMQRPITEMDLHKIANRVRTCVILHNQCMSDRVMEDVHARYNPAHSVVEEEMTIEYPDDLEEKQGPDNKGVRARIGMRKCSKIEIENLTRRHAWNDLLDVAEHGRLHKALMKHVALVHKSNK